MTSIPRKKREAMRMLAYMCNISVAKWNDDDENAGGYIP
jgi:hypothetical protein